MALVSEGKMAVEPGSGNLKEDVRRHWYAQPCGTRDIPAQDRASFFADAEAEGCACEPSIAGFAGIARGRGKDGLEVGVGAGTDFVNWVRHGAPATGVDVTPRGVGLTRGRFALEGLHADVGIGDAERLAFSLGGVHALDGSQRGEAAPVAIASLGDVSPRGESGHEGIHQTESSRAGRRLSRVSGRSSRMVTCCSCGRRRSGAVRSIGCSGNCTQRWLVRRTGNVFGTNLVIEAVK